jgi:hypothetical protein
MQRAILIKEIIDVFSHYKQATPYLFLQNGQVDPQTAMPTAQRW